MAFLVGLLALAPGCVTPGGARSAAHQLRPIGVWYSVATAELASPNGLAETLERDFADISTLDIQTVFLRNVAPDRWPAVLDAAAAHRLDLVVPDERAIHYVRTGHEAGALPGLSDAVTQSRRVTGRFVGQAVDATTARRIRDLAESSGRWQGGRLACATIDMTAPITAPPLPRAHLIAAMPSGARGDAGAVSPKPALTGAMATVQCMQHRKDELATVRRWLADYHAGLLAGCTGGVVFDAYRALPGNWQGIIRADRPMSPERKAMIKLICLRAAHWSRLLDGLRATAIQVPGRHDRPLRAAVFADDHRGYLLICNTSTERFVRTEVSLPTVLGGRPVHRAVTVSPPEQMQVGAVYDARGGTLTITLHLSPGDAELFELF